MKTTGTGPVGKESATIAAAVEYRSVPPSRLMPGWSGTGGPAGPVTGGTMGCSGTTGAVATSTVSTLSVSFGQASACRTSAACSAGSTVIDQRTLIAVQAVM
jgi:hypothetical protein